MATATKAKDDFTTFPANADNYFQAKSISISGLPISIRQDIETTKIVTVFKSAKQYYDYLEREIAFWSENDPKNDLNDYTQYNKLKQARADFSQAISYYNTYPANSATGDRSMNQSINHLSNGHLCSKTKLAKFLLANKGKGSNYISGFVSSLSVNRGTGLPSSIDAVEGFIVGLEYTKTVKQLFAVSVEDMKEFSSSVQEATDNYTKLNSSYTVAFHEHEEMLASISKQADDQIAQMKTNADTYFAEREKRCQELENLYEEKLRLQAPAEYWGEMEQEYTKKGRWWLGVSIVFTALIVGTLVTVLALLPNLFSENSHWFDVFKNSAIITVVTSIAVYMLRLFVKLSTSSFHLSRDAKERNKLTYFYLALMEKKAVNEKERAIVLNALFSRADTGLLKGDSSPAMSSNVTDLVKNLGGNK